jgi:dipicolinate synthase subunit A
LRVEPGEGTRGHLAVVAADRREHEAASELMRRGVPVRIWQAPGPGGDAADPGALRGVLTGAAALLGPLRLPVDVHPALDLLPPGAPVIVGVADSALRAVAARRDLHVRAYAEDETFAVRNAVPTAEGAVVEATRLAGVTAHGVAAAVLGFGRCGQALAERLLAWHARVTVVARRPEALALAASRGAAAAAWSELPAVLVGSRLVFNTVPAPVLGPRQLAVLGPRAWVFDLASAPGGVDFAAAEALGVHARLLPGLPGRLYPETAGCLVAETVYAWLPPVLRRSEV